MAGPTGFPAAPMQTVFADTTFDTPRVNVADFDPVDVLPAAPAAKLRALRQRSADLKMVVPEFEAVQDVSIERIKTERELKRFTDAASEGGFNLPATDQRVIAARKRLDKLSAELSRLSMLKETRTATWRTAISVLGAVEEWLHGRPSGTTLEAVEVEAPAPNKGESITEAILRLRHRVRELRADLSRIESAPFPSSHAKRKMREQIEALAARGQPNVSRLVEADAEIHFATMLQRVSVHHAQPGASAHCEPTDVLGLICWLHKAALISALDREIDAEADDRAALPPEARERAAAQLLTNLLEIERQEAALVWMAMEQNLPVEFRADTNPLAILSVRLVTAAKVERPADTTWPHAYELAGR